MLFARRFWLASAAAWSALSGTTSAAHTQAAPDSAPRSAMHDYLTECRADGGAWWGQSLCGPIILVEPATRHGYASEKPPGGEFSLVNGVWVGTVPSGIPLSNTSLTWAGTRWAFVRLPLSGSRRERVGLLLHESFHRIEDSLHLGGADPMLPHLDERDGRYWLRLEIRAIGSALSQTGAAGQAATRDAMLFRARRVSLYPGSDSLEDMVERDEGMAEYTGTALALMLTGEPTSSTASLFADFESRPTFVRSLGYGTGPGLGLLLDRYAPGWRKRVAGKSPAGMLATAVGFAPGNDLARQAEQRARLYHADELARQEDARERDRQTRLGEYRQGLLEGPVLVLSQDRLSRAFNPNTLIAFGAEGTIYPTGTFSADWGALTVDSAGALVSADFRQLRVALPRGAAASPLKGAGWTLELKPGWQVVKGTRPGDLTVVPDSVARP